MISIAWIVQKYDFGHSRDKSCKLCFTVNTDDFVVNAAYIFGCGKLKKLYGDAVLFLHNDRKWTNK